MPVIESTVMPATAGEILNRSGLVPPDAVNAVEESARPNVVMIFEPPPITTGTLTRMVVAL